MRAPVLLAVVSATAVVMPGGLAAQEYCVACTGPSATYRCVIGDARLAQGQPLQTFCITTLTREGGHQRCQIKPGTVFDCDGPVKKLATKPQGGASGAPATVDRLAKDWVRSSGEKAGKAGEAIDSGARSVWGCVSSLFKSC